MLEFDVHHSGSHPGMIDPNELSLPDKFFDQHLFALLLSAVLSEGLAADSGGLIEGFHTHDS